jgi:hypothetical protein
MEPTNGPDATKSIGTVSLAPGTTPSFRVSLEPAASLLRDRA